MADITAGLVEGAQGGAQLATSMQNLAFAQQEEPSRLAFMEGQAADEQASAAIKQQTVDLYNRQVRAAQLAALAMHGKAISQSAGPAGLSFEADSLTQVGQIALSQGLLADGTDYLQKAVDVQGKAVDNATKQANLHAVGRKAIADGLQEGASPQEIQMIVAQTDPDMLQDPTFRKLMQHAQQDPQWLAQNRAALASHLYSVQDRLDQAAQAAKVKADNATANYNDAAARLETVQANLLDISRTAGAKAGVVHDPTALMAMLHDAGLSDTLQAAAGLIRANPNMSDEDIVKQETERRASSPANRGGAAQQTQFLRVQNAGHQIALEARNVMQMPISATSMLGTANLDGGLGEATQAWLTRKISPETAAMLTPMMAGLGRFTGTLEAFGTAYGIQGLSQAAGDQLEVRPGEQVVQKLTQMAELRQISEGSLDTLESSPLVPPQQKAAMEDIRKQLQAAVPFTVEDIEDFMKRSGKMQGQTFGEFIRRHSIGGGGRGAAPPTITNQADYDKLPRGARYTGPDGTVYTKQ